MRQGVDLYTLDMIDAPRRGRPRKPNALTPAERARRYRARKRDHNKSDAPDAGIDYSKPAWPLHGMTAEELRAQEPPYIEPRERRKRKAGDAA